MMMQSTNPEIAASARELSRNPLTSRILIMMVMVMMMMMIEMTLTHREMTESYVTDSRSN